MVDHAQLERKLLRSLGAQRRRRLGCYLTPEPIAELMARFAVKYQPSGPVLDPAAGTGRLLAAVARHRLRVTQSSGQLELPGLSPHPELSGSFHGVELAPELARATNELLAGVLGVDADYCAVHNALMLLDPELRREILGHEHLDVVIANPPYVREKGNRGAFQALRYPGSPWTPLLGPRQDLQQLFLVLGVHLLAPGGILVYLVNTYWLTNDSGQRVRDLLDSHMAVRALVDFGPVRLFPSAPGQHNLLVVAQDTRGLPEDEPPSLTVARVEEGAGKLDVADVADALGHVFFGDASPKNAVPLDVTKRTRLVRSGTRHRWYLPSRSDVWLTAVEHAAVPLGRCFETHQGVVSGADILTSQNRRWLAKPERWPVGTGIFVLTASELEKLDLADGDIVHVRPLFRAAEVGPFSVNRRGPREGSYILYLHRDVCLDEASKLLLHLERFRPILERRREVRSGGMRWYGLHWPRDPHLFDRPRLAVPRRAKVPRFAMCPAGFCEQSDLALITDPQNSVDRLRALGVVLNSEVVSRWCLHRGKQKGKIREFFGRALEELPIPRAAITETEAFDALAKYADAERYQDAEQLVRQLYAL